MKSWKMSHMNDDSVALSVCGSGVVFEFADESHGSSGARSCVDH